MSVSASVTTRRLAAAVLTAGTLVGTVALPASAADHARPYRPQVEITHVQYDTPGRDDRSNRSLNSQWVELTNTTRHSVNMDGWTLSDREGRTYTFHHYRLDRRATVRVHTGVGRDSRRDLFQDRHHVVWDRRDTATLRNDDGRVVDSVSWGGERHGHRSDDRRTDRQGDRDNRRHDDHRDDRDSRRHGGGHHD